MIALTKISETSTTITLGWTPVSGATGYRLSAEKQAKPSHTWDPARSQAKFAKGSAWYKVEALGVQDSGIYTGSEPPPPPPPGEYPPSFYTGPGKGGILPSSPGVLVGVAQADGAGEAPVTQQMAALETYLGRKVVIEHRFMQSTNTLDLNLIATIAARGHVPMISWMPNPSNGGRILRGDADAGIRSVGQQIASQPHKILLRPYWEFNGYEDAARTKGWYDHSNDVDGTHLTHDEFRQMWQRTVDRLREGGAFPKASLLWCPMEGWYGNGDAFNDQLAYPGDEYVDWVCADGYNGNTPGSYCGAMDHPHANWCEFREIFHDSLLPGGSVEIDFRNRKPFMVAEVGVVEDAANAQHKGDWFRKARDDIKAHMPGLMAFVYFDIDSRKYEETKNWLIGTSASAKQGFKDLALDPYFTRQP